MGWIAKVMIVDDKLRAAWIEYAVFIPDNRDFSFANLALSNVTIKCNYSATRDVNTMALI